MNPFFFGSGQRRLFGLYTPSRVAGAGARAVVLCHPWGNEYLGAHRSMRHLAKMLSGAGFHVLRFDYFGTGDSAGDMRQADLQGWQGDIEMAIEELRDTTGVARVGLAGLRLGATLAAGVAARRPKEVDALALWDPIASGSDYLRELRNGVPAPATGGGDEEIGGFPLTRAMAGELQGIDLAAPAAAVAARTLVVVSTEGDACAALRARLDGRFPALEVEQIISAPAWVENVSFQTGEVPVKLLQRIVEWFR